MCFSSRSVSIPCNTQPVDTKSRNISSGYNMNRFSLSAVHAVTFVKDCYVQNSLQFQSRSISLGSGRSRGWCRCRRRRCARALREGAPVLGDLNGKDQNQDRPGPPRTTDEHLGRPPLSRRRPARRGGCLQSRTRARLVTMCRFVSYQQGTRQDLLGIVNSRSASLQ